jgi:hypothetical protein
VAIIKDILLNQTAIAMNNAQKRRKILALRLCPLIMMLATSLLGCSNRNNSLGMAEDSSSDEAMDPSQLSPATQRIAAKAKERVNYYQVRAKNTKEKADQVQKKVEEAQKKLEVQQQEYAEQVEQAAIAQHNLATNMLRLGAPLAEVAAATGLSSLDVRSRLLQEIRDIGRVKGKL